MLALLLHDVYEREPAESGFPGALAGRYKVTLPELDFVLRALDAAWHTPPLLASDASICQRHGFALTVDDGGVSYYTVLADRLEGRGWRGHCFVCTGMVGSPGFLTARQLRELDRRGHLIGSHSMTHPTRFSACSPARMLAEWQGSRNALEDLLGHEVRLASVPGGYFSESVARAARDGGLEVLFTSEPWLGAKSIHGCAVAGRFTVRSGRRRASIEALVRGSLGTRCLEWTAWNLKKVVKPVLGPAYPRLGEWLASVQLQGGRR